MDTFANNPAGTYARYIAACNERRLNDIGEFIATDVEGVRSGFGAIATDFETSRLRSPISTGRSKS